MTAITIVRPEGETDYLCRVPAALVEQFSEWAQVAYVRFQPIGENAVELVLAREEDLERITAPSTSTEEGRP